MDTCSVKLGHDLNLFEMIQKDKILHFICCFVPSLLGLYGVAFVICASIVKEWKDSKHKGNIWSWGDILADVAGIVAGIGIHFLIFKDMKM